ncbi:HSPB1-associated protein 1 isoform X2 [Rhinoderma darwinii]|uniref:HSPB1-associated protein 1 isoform X2 n=1 Tax=Rhinoderma darwinii TaxID=43563 RepID=UPI003F66F02F
MCAALRTEPAVMGAADAVPKPFTPQEARDLILGVARPAVFLNMTDDWPASRWTLTRLCDVLQEQTLRFRIGRRKMDTEPQFETQCDYVDGTIRQFQEWISGNCQEESGPFGRFDSAESWAYADYKYLALLFKDKAEMLQDVSWADFGFPGRDGRDSTLWVGSRGANTPCHIDSYGCNLVLQVQGRKKWHLFPPEDTTYLYPTRIPYEESSIFSKVNVVNPDQQHYPAFSKARPHVVTLDPGQVLVVPRRWWHYVESVDDVTVSVNSWLELDSDHEARVEEAITRMVVCAFKSADGSESSEDWLNPTEDGATTHETNLQYLNMAVSAFAEHKMEENVSDQDEPIMKRRKETNQEADDRSRDSTRFSPFLVPVLPSLTNEDSRRIETAGPRSAEKQIKDGGTGAITSDELLDCLLNPQVVHVVTQLLVNRRLGKS